MSNIQKGVSVEQAGSLTSLSFNLYLYEEEEEEDQMIPECNMNKEFTFSRLLVAAVALRKPNQPTEEKVGMKFLWVKVVYKFLLPLHSRL